MDFALQKNLIKHGREAALLSQCVFVHEPENVEEVSL
jgi:hypothetical protein